MNSGNALASGSHVQEYRIDAVLGQGAFAITYRGWDEHLKAMVAIKEFFPGQIMARDADGGVSLKQAGDAELFEWGLSRFVAEAQVLAQFRHPNIVRVVRYFVARRTAAIVWRISPTRAFCRPTNWSASANRTVRGKTTASHTIAARSASSNNRLTASTISSPSVRPARCTIAAAAQPRTGMRSGVTPIASHTSVASAIPAAFNASANT